MNCPVCGYVIPDGAGFCSQCGTKIAVPATAQPIPQSQSMPQPAGVAQPAAPGPQFQPMGQPAGAAQPVAPQMAPTPAQPTPMQAPYGAPAQAPQPQAVPFGAQPQPAQPAKGATDMADMLHDTLEPIATPAEAAAEPARKGMSPLKYGLIAGGVVIALILGSMFLPAGDGGSEDTGADNAPGETTEATSSDSAGTGDVVTLTEDTEVEFEGVHFTIPAGWEEYSLSSGLDYSCYEGDYWADLMVNTIGESGGSFDADSYLADRVEMYEGMSEVDVLNANTTSIDGYPAIYMESVFHFDDIDDSYEMLIIMDTPSGQLVEVNGTCPEVSGEDRDALHAIADTITIP